MSRNVSRLGAVIWNKVEFPPTVSSSVSPVQKNGNILIEMIPCWATYCRERSKGIIYCSSVEAFYIVVGSCSVRSSKGSPSEWKDKSTPSGNSDWSPESIEEHSGIQHRVETTERLTGDIMTRTKKTIGGQQTESLLTDCALSICCCLMAQPDRSTDYGAKVILKETNNIQIINPRNLFMTV